MENHCCLSLSKCENDQAEFKHRRLRGKSKMREKIEHTHIHRYIHIVRELSLAFLKNFLYCCCFEKYYNAADHMQLV